MKIGFKTLEELQNKYPINSIFIERDKEEVRYITAYNKTDLDYYKTVYSKLEPVYGETYKYKVTFKKHIESRVQGYIYDGELWYPAYETWDGWLPYIEPKYFNEE